MEFFLLLLFIVISVCHMRPQWKKAKQAKMPAITGPRMKFGQD